MLFSAPDNREEESTRRRMSDSTLREPRNAYYVHSGTAYARDDDTRQARAAAARAPARWTLL